MATSLPPAEHTAAPEPRTPKEPEAKSTKWWQLATVILGFLTALVTLIAGLQTVGKNDATNKSEDLSSSLSSAQAANSSLTRQLSSATAAESSLSDANASLQAELSAGPTAAGGPSGSVAPTSVTVRRQTKDLALVYGAPSVDLDSKTDPQWRGSAPDIGWEVSRFSYAGSSSSAWIVPMNQKADYNTCYNSTLWDSPQLDTSSLEVNQTFCFKTSEGRYAAIQVLRMTQKQADIAAVIYDPPDTQ